MFYAGILVVEQHKVVDIFVKCKENVFICYHYKCGKCHVHIYSFMIPINKILCNQFPSKVN